LKFTIFEPENAVTFELEKDIEKWLFCVRDWKRERDCVCVCV